MSKYSAHRNPRIIVNPKVNYVILTLGRVDGTNNITDQQVKLIVKRRVVSATHESEWMAHAVNIQTGEVHFEIAPEFLSDTTKFPAGFYDAKLYHNDCHVADVEIIKDAGLYVQSHRSVEACSTTAWVDPECVEDNDEECCSGCSKAAGSPCGCDYGLTDNCPACLNITSVAKITIEDGYMSI